MSEVTREEFDMLIKQVDEDRAVVKEYFEKIQDTQEQMKSSAADEKTFRIEHTGMLNQMCEDVSCIKSDKVWFNRLVVGFVFLSAFGGVWKFVLS